MANGIIVAVGHNLKRVPYCHSAGRSIRMLALCHSIAFASHLPNFLAGKGINRHHPRAAGMDELQIQPPLKQQRRGMKTKTQTKTPVSFLRVEAPGGLAIEFRRSHITIAGHRINVP